MRPASFGSEYPARSLESRVAASMASSQGRTLLRVYGASVGRWLGWVGLVGVALLCAVIMLDSVHPPGGGNVAQAQLALTPESGECAAWENVANVAEHMSRDQLRELQRQVCPDLPLSDPQRDGN
jgi:hypothetical protein